MSGQSLGNSWTAPYGQRRDRDFDNLSFDLLSLRGVRNLIWRTPGRDGGRDLEGPIQKVDFSGNVVFEKWYFERKRYVVSLSWPVVLERLGYAANTEPDYLLFITSSGFSPSCLDIDRRLHKTE
jgi:Restriction endonuclease